MAGRQGGAAAPWRSYHIFLDGPLEPYLVEHFEARLRSEITARRVRRFFFLRFGKGKGAHLRLRFLPGEGFAERRLEDAIRGAARQYAGRRGVVRPGFVLERHPYCRSCLYFGDNNLSVYSELLNEATSWLALGLMHSLGPERRAERWVVAACLSASIVHRAVRDRGAADRLLQRAASFARRAAAEYGFGPTRQSAGGPPQRARTPCGAERGGGGAPAGSAPERCASQNGGSRPRSTGMPLWRESCAWPGASSWLGWALASCSYMGSISCGTSWASTCPRNTRRLQRC